jgi:hypothetical protein
MTEETAIKLTEALNRFSAALERIANPWAYQGGLGIQGQSLPQDYSGQISQNNPSPYNQ